MKKILFFAAAVALFVSCGEGSKSSQEKIRQDSLAAVKADSLANIEMAKAHTAQNSLDIKGTYSGIVPCADCEGIETKIILSDSTFVRTSLYLGKQHKKVFEEKGTFSWNPDGNSITLKGITDGAKQYVVMENALKQLDLEGKEITGEHAEQYILRK